MLSCSFALTKIQTPRCRANLITRPMLERRLGEALATRRLTLVSAPAGFGKTAALSRQIQLLPEGTAVAWIAADEDDDLHRFLACLMAALEPYDLPWRTAPDALITVAVNAREERRAVANELLNALAACEVQRGLIVLDDAHRIPDIAVFEFIDLLLERLPERWGFVIGSRVDPPLTLARLRAQDDLAEIRQADLRFSREDIAAMIAAKGSDAEVTRLLARTRGWAAGLRLTLNSARRGHGAPNGATARAMDRDVFDYLASEVLDEMPADLRDFLLRCSVLPVLTPSRCALVSGNARAGQWLEEIEQRELFVSVLDGPEITLTLHELFRDCLADRLQREHPEEVPLLLRRAAQCEPDAIRRLSLLLSAGAWLEAESALDEVAAQLLAGGVVEAVPRLIAQFPPERRKSSPSIALVRALTAWDRWDWAEMIDAARDAVAGFARLGDEPQRQRALVLQAIALTGNGWTSESAAKLAELPDEVQKIETQALAQALRAWHALDTGDFGSVAGHYMKVLDSLEQIDSLQVWFHAFRRPLYVRLPGMRAPLARFVEGAMRRVGDSSPQMRVLANVIAAWLALWRGELNEAMERIASAETEARWLGMPRQMRTSLNTCLAAAHAIRGDRKAAMAAIGALLSDFGSPLHAAPAPGRTSMLGHYMFYGIRIADAVDDVQSVREFVGRMPAREQITNAPMLTAALLTLPARLAAIEGDHELACEHWARALVNPTAIDIIGQAHEARIRYASSLLMLSRRAEAAAALRLVFDEVAVSGEIGGALLAGRRIIAQLASASWHNELARRELAQLRDWARRLQSAHAGEPQSNNHDRLTSRELEIVQRIAAGESNKHIARALDLSPHTVKRHVANILEKLGVSSRGQAALWYRTQS